MGLFVVSLVVMVLMQASATKQDTATTTAANDIALKLDDYISTQGAIPSSLAATGVKRVPSTITYQKVSDSTYKFCTTYKSASSGFDATTAVQNAVGGYTGVGSSYYAPPTDNTYLYISDVHHKGVNCQVIKPYLYSTGGTITPVSQTTGTGYLNSSYSSSQGCQPGYLVGFNGVITAIAPGQGSTNSSLGAPVTITVTGAGKTLSVLVPSSSNVYDSSCTPLKHAQLKLNDNVDVFFNSQTTTDYSTSQAVVDTSQFYDASVQ